MTDGNRQGDLIKLVCGCFVRTPRHLGRGKARQLRLARVQAGPCRQCAHQHAAEQAQALTDIQGQLLNPWQRGVELAKARRRVDRLRLPDSVSLARLS